MRIFISTFLLFCLYFPSTVLSQTDRGETQPSDSLLIVEYIDIIGNIKTRPRVIHRNLDFTVGQAIDVSALERNYLRLEATNYFTSVSISSKPGSKLGKIGVIIEVKERWWPTLHFEGGHSELDGWYFSPLTVRGDNFLGFGNYNSISLLYGHRMSALDIKFYNPTFLVKDTFIKINVTARSRNFIHYFDAKKYTERVATGELRLTWGGTSGFFSHFHIELESSNVDADSFATYVRNTEEKRLLPPMMLQNVGKVLRHSVTLVAHKDTRDNPFYPTKGFWGAVWTEFSRGDTVHNSNFTKLTFDARAYKSIFNTHVIAARLKVGQATPSTPFYERFYFSGPNSLRGYEDRSLTPVGYGTQLFLTNFEYRFPITSEGFPNHKWTGTFFLDFGGLWQPNDIICSDDICSGAGFGIRVKLPVVGLVRLEWAFPLQVKDYQLHLSLAHMF